MEATTTLHWNEHTAATKSFRHGYSTNVPTAFNPSTHRQIIDLHQKANTFLPVLLHAKPSGGHFRRAPNTNVPRGRPAEQLSCPALDETKNRSRPAQQALCAKATG